MQGTTRCTNELFWIRFVAGSLVVEMHVPDVTLRKTELTKGLPNKSFVPLGRAKKKELTLEGVWSDGKRCIFWHDYQLSKQPLKNVVSMLIKDKDITSYTNCCKLKYLLLWLWIRNFFLFLFFEKSASVGRWEWPNWLQGCHNAGQRAIYFKKANISTSATSLLQGQSYNEKK